MKIPGLDDMLTELKSKVASPERKQVLADLTADLAVLSSRALAGEDVSKEIQQDKAQGLMLSASEIQLVQNSLLNFVALLVGAVVRGAVAGI